METCTTVMHIAPHSTLIMMNRGHSAANSRRRWMTFETTALPIPYGEYTLKPNLWQPGRREQNLLYSGPHLQLTFRWFKSNHHHGTIMPSNSALASPSCSVLNNSGLGPPSDALINTDSAPGFHTTHGNLARPVVISTGIHKTTRKKDASRAAQYRNVRAAQAAVGNYWRSQGVRI